MAEDNANALKTVKDNFTCEKCGANEWFIQGLLEKAQAAGKLPAKARRASSVSTVSLQNKEKQMKIGDTFDIAYIARDVCKNCLHEQVIRLEVAEGRVVYNASHLLEGMPFEPPRGASGLQVN